MSTIYDHFSRNWGATWSTPVLVATGVTPSEAELADGVIFCSYEDGGTCLLRESEDGGSTWSAAFGGGTGTYPFVWTDLDQASLFRALYDSGKVWFSRSADRGATWTAAVEVGTLVVGARISGIVLPDGRLRISWDDSGAIEKVSDDGGATWA